MKIPLLVFIGSIGVHSCQDPTPMTHPVPLPNNLDSTFSDTVTPTDSSESDTSPLKEFDLPIPPNIKVNVTTCIEMAEDKPFVYEDLDIPIECIIPAQIMTLTEMPEFPGGADAMTAFIVHNLNYPASCKKRSIEGQVYVKFTIDSTGRACDIAILRSLDPAADSALMTVIESMPLWKPGYDNDVPVACQMALPVMFSLSGSAPKAMNPNFKPSLLSYNSNSNDTAFADSMAIDSLRALKTTDINVYPNPADNFCRIALSQTADDLSYNIFDIKGNLMASGPLTASDQTIELNNYTAGTYMVRVTSNSLKLSESIRLQLR